MVDITLPIIPPQQNTVCHLRIVENTVVRAARDPGSVVNPAEHFHLFLSRRLDYFRFFIQLT